MADKVAGYEIAANGQQQQQKTAMFQASKANNNNEPIKSKQADEYGSNSGSSGYYPLNVAQKGKLILPTALWILLIIGGICFLTLMVTLNKTMGTLETMVDLEQEKLDMLEAIERHQRAHHYKSSKLGASEEPILGRHPKTKKHLHESKRPIVIPVQKSEILGHRNHHHSSNDDSESVVGSDSKLANSMRIDFIDPEDLSDVKRPIDSQFDDTLSPTSIASWFALPNWISLEPPIKSDFEKKQQSSLKHDRGSKTKLSREEFNDEDQISSGGVIITASSGPDGKTSIVEQRFGDADTGIESMFTGSDDGQFGDMPGVFKSMLEQFKPKLESAISKDATKGSSLLSNGKQQLDKKSSNDESSAGSGMPGVSAKIDNININLGFVSDDEQESSKSRYKGHKKTKPPSREEEINSLGSSIDSLVSKLMISQQNEDDGGLPNLIMFPSQQKQQPEHSKSSLLSSLSVPLMMDNGNNNDNSDLGPFVLQSYDSQPSLSSLIDIGGSPVHKPTHHKHHRYHKHPKHHLKHTLNPQIMSSPYEAIGHFDDLTPSSPLIIALDGNDFGGRNKDDLGLPIPGFGRPQLIQGDTHLPSSIGQSPYELLMQPSQFKASNDNPDYYDDVPTHFFKDLSKNLHQKHQEQLVPSNALENADQQAWNYLADDMAGAFVQSLLKSHFDDLKQQQLQSEKVEQPSKQPTTVFGDLLSVEPLSSPDDKSSSDKQSNEGLQIIKNPATLEEVLDSISGLLPDSKLVVIPETKEQQTNLSSALNDTTTSPIPISEEGQSLKSPSHQEKTDEVKKVEQMVANATSLLTNDGSTKPIEVDASARLEPSTNQAEGKTIDLGSSILPSVPKISDAATSTSQQPSSTVTTVQFSDSNDEFAKDFGSFMSNIFTLPRFDGRSMSVRSDNGLESSQNSESKSGVRM